MGSAIGDAFKKITENIVPLSHKIWGLHRMGHNAHVLGKLAQVSRSQPFSTKQVLHPQSYPQNL